MPKTKPTKLTNFFEGHRRKATLIAWSHLKTKAGESRIKLDLRLPLLNESLVGINDAIGVAFGMMREDNSKIDRTSLNIELEGMTLETFSTGEVKHVSVSSTGVKMQKVAVVSGGEGEKRTVDLVLVAYVPASIQLRDWAWNHLHSEFHLEAVYSQSEMEFSDIVEDEEESEDEDDELDTDNEQPAVKVKSGPKELAEFHAKQVQ